MKINKTLLEWIKLFLNDPKTFLYILFFVSNAERYQYCAYNPEIKRFAKQITDELYDILPSAQVYFIGSAALGLSGERDIDIFVEAQDWNYDQYVKKIDEEISSATNRTNEFTEFVFPLVKYRVELTVIKSYSRRWEIIRRTHELLINSRIKEEYKELKKSFKYATKREAEFAKAFFFQKHTQ